MASTNEPRSQRRAGKKWIAEKEAELRERPAVGKGAAGVSAALEQPTGGVFVKEQALGLSEIYNAASRGIGGATMRQVNHDELAWKIATALRPIAGPAWKAAADPHVGMRDPAAARVADMAAHALRSLGVLPTAPEAPATSFSRPLDRLRGEIVGSGAPIMESDEGPC